MITTGTGTPLNAKIEFGVFQIPPFQIPPNWTGSERHVHFQANDVQAQKPILVIHQSLHYNGIKFLSVVIVPGMISRG